MNPSAPNISLQRTGACAPAAELGSFGRAKIVATVLVSLVSAIASSACASSVHVTNLVVWNQAHVPERISISIDDSKIYSGILGTIDSFPMIVIQEPLGFTDGHHVLSVSVPGRSFSKSVAFTVGKERANLHVMVNREDVQVGVTYGFEAYQ
jgi:hypothetical protein